MSRTEPLARTLHDVGLAAWFGGSLMGVTGLNGALDAVGDPAERERLAGAGWGRWGRIGSAAMATHLLGGAGLLVRNVARARREPAAATAAVSRAALTGAALAATAYAGALGRRAGSDAPAGAGPAAPEPALARRIRAVEWAVPALTGAAVVVGAVRGR
ncbi:hypothetical protein [Pseudonocardia sp. HH130629-09]|uniref:hypothetical protein n=1 Tax=Pseudonocardia sp. HH130629-09 TaxID=1641402 RepID=UPI0006CB361A|nr:hypothetical protein [Pseudonocardia sp. HH130629-09]ALE82139.1 hypothetical protein XF36_02455 [Pseudonocardia sp. HH130629-09]